MNAEERKTGGLAASGKTKTEHYNWDELDSACKYMRIDIKKLNIGPYQRGEASAFSVIEKARHMQHAALGAVVVGKRDDGTFWLVDGLQRKLAAQRRGDVSGLDCMVFNSKGEKHEAEIFLLCNKGRIAVDAVHKYRTSVIAGRDPEKSIDLWLTQHELQIINDKSKGKISFPTAIVQSWNNNADVCKRALLATREICDGRILRDIFQGVALLIKHGVNVEGEQAKLFKIGGQARLQKEINTVAILSGKGKNWTVCARGVLNAINYRRRRKVVLDILGI